MRRAVFCRGCLARILLLAVVALLPGCASRSLEDGSVTLQFAGDVLLDREPARTIRTEGVAAAVRDIASFTGDADIAFCNLECPVVAVPRKVPKQFAFAASPQMVEVLKAAHFRIVSLANNHAMDCSRPGLVETMEHLRDAGIMWCGAGMTRQRAHAPTILLCRGLRIGYLAYSDLLPQGVVGFPELPNLAYVDDPAIEEEVRTVRQGVDILVISFHWGVERQTRQTGRQEDLARRVVSAGADIVVGHHPHVLQPLVAWRREDGRTAVVAYSLGNFVFNSLSAVSARTMLLECRAGRSGVEAVRTCRMVICDGIPRREGGWVQAHSLRNLSSSPRTLFSPGAGSR